jgi:tetratricopeptide (TPR) repeat protein
MKEERVVFPTYPVGKPDRNPMFLEKRVYQGSSGKVYPLPTIESIGDEKEDREYRAVVLENDFLSVTILPELGGRIHRARDKTNNYDFVYFNHVVKPALVGLAGPWISGGIEFNWPQHHRPSTFLPVSHELVENDDGSKTVWVGETDRMYGTRGMAGITLYPDRAYIEIKGRVHNGTLTNQSFLWWANPAVPVNDKTRSVFPSDVHAVFDHGKRDVSKFPIATGVYYKQDYSEGVDIARYRNVPVPTSYMAYHSDFDFVGGYDYGVGAGLLHVANHHISPGKKQWTWGNADFGQAWDRNLTDSDGPYIELMTGVYTDNQPDFTWLKPGETKTFSQYFMPYKRVGQVADATKECVAAFEVVDASIRLGVYASVPAGGWRVAVSAAGLALLDETVALRPAETFEKRLDLPAGVAASECRLTVSDAAGKTLVDYAPAAPKDLVIPDPAKAARDPGDIKTNEELYLAGIHLEQYRHATYRPEDYYLEALKRDPDDMRVNSAYADLMLRRGRFDLAERHYRAAVARSRLYNANPRDGEPLYGLGLTLKLRGDVAGARDHLYRATWDGAYCDKGYFTLAQLALIDGDPVEALALVGQSLAANGRNSRARHLKGAILRRLGKNAEAVVLGRDTLADDPLDVMARYELALALDAGGAGDAAGTELRAFERLMNGEARNYLELAAGYEDAGEWEEAAAMLERYLALGGADNPEVRYHLGWCKAELGLDRDALDAWRSAEASSSEHCFPNRLHSLLALEAAIAALDKAPRARYYLGCLFYDARRHDDAAALWERAAAEDPSFPTVFRNLALYYANKLGEWERARAALENAYSLDRSDARILFELDQLYKKTAAPHAERLAFLGRHLDEVRKRDDVYIEFVTLHNNLRRHEEALRLLAGRCFHPWEGGEGKSVGQYVLAHVELAKQALEAGDADTALGHLAAAKTYPRNLGEGKLPGAAENRVDYLLGLAHERRGDADAARRAFEAAAAGDAEPTGVMYYNDQPADAIYYQGLAWRRLGNRFEANKRFHRLFDYGEKHVNDAMRIDYFAVSLPDFLVFEEDLNRKNAAYCRYLMGLGLLGLGERGAGERSLDEARALDPNHQGVLFVWKEQ